MEIMDASDWDSVLQFLEPFDLDFASPAPDCQERVSFYQIPTPPDSQDGSPTDEENIDGHTFVSVSTTFFPGSNNDPLPPDLILLSADSVFFYVHTHLILSASENAFKSLIPPPSSTQKGKDQLTPIVSVPESAAILNVILHCIYDLSCAHYSPPFDALVAAVDALSDYGVNPKLCIVPSSALYTLLLSHAPLHPLELYALAASHDLRELAAATSSHLLSFSLATLSDTVAERIGPVYLKRLFFLHFGRVDALKRLLLPPPHPHAPTPWCDFTEQKKLTRAWALASAYLAWDARPDLSTSTMEFALTPLEEHLACDLCRQALKERVKNLIVQWTVVKRTI